MEITLSPAALEALKDKLQKNTTGKVVRIYLAGVGCGGGGTASFSLVFDELQAGDTLQAIDGVNVYYDKLTPMHVNQLRLDFKPSDYEDEQFKVTGQFIAKT